MKQLAEQFTEQFERKNRDNGDIFYCLKDSASKELRDLVHTAHDEFLPDDHKYRFIYDALIGISESYSMSEIITADDYTSDLTNWLNSNNTRVYYLTEAIENFQPSNGFNLLQIAQEIEKEEVYNSVLNSLENLL